MKDQWIIQLSEPLQCFNPYFTRLLCGTAVSHHYGRYFLQGAFRDLIIIFYIETVSVFLEIGTVCINDKLHSQHLTRRDHNISMFHKGTTEIELLTFSSLSAVMT